MKIHLLIVLFLSVFGPWASASEALRVTLSIPVAEGTYGSLTGDKGRSVILAKAIPFYLLLTNDSKTVERIWMEWNSWGYDNLSFELTDEQGHKVMVERPLTGFTVNSPTWWVLEPGETHVFEIHCAGPEGWTGFPSLPAGERRLYTVRALYRVGESPESKRYGVWTGDIASEPVRVIFHAPNHSGPITPSREPPLRSGR